MTPGVLAIIVLCSLLAFGAGLVLGLIVAPVQALPDPVPVPVDPPMGPPTAKEPPPLATLALKLISVKGEPVGIVRVRAKDRRPTVLHNGGVYQASHMDREGHVYRCVGREPR